ncbi:PAS domain-containing hybrid sensor histidine kinase/response regulator [Piscinibacter gummiphilus]|uniref:histidine kinase n=1 Tax=Piscinibacter gummiphilus TaxID=946333 RepID=A0A1W6LDX2_9BURK|nr:PAS domain-containing sensor histidine kinase [Piscinibacter gummiphilus]ARN22429.1 hypothetical protein A4W93_22370 [Piscinibacter gummiphilus]GLS98007.1 histidine kinase [Piscinibacter gummiphilus]
MSEAGRVLSWSKAPWHASLAPTLPLDPRLMSQLLQHIATRVAVVDRDLRYVWANAQALAFMELPEEEVIGHHLSEVLDPALYESFVPLFERLFAGESLHLEGWVDYERQGRRYREQDLVPYVDEEGEVVLVVVCGLDHTEARIGELQLAEKQRQLKASEALKAAVFDNALAALVSTDHTGSIVEFNPAAETMFGWRRADVIGRKVGELLIPERHRRTYWNEIPGMLGRRVELEARRADGREFPIEMVMWRTEADGTVFFTASFADLSERYAAARQIEQQREALRQGEKLTMMGSLLAGVAHELNNPLAVAMGRALLLQERAADRPDLVQEARRIHDATDRCARIVRTFLNMARSRPADRQPVDLNQVVRGAAEMLGYAYRSSGVDLALALDPALPEFSGDPDQLCQVVLNLLVNAQHAVSMAPAPRVVRVSTASDGPTVRLQVDDSGPGVPPDVAARLFEPFFTTKAEGVGTGLGLSVSRSVAREHGGDLVLGDPSALGGASFRLTLAAPEQVIAAQPEPPEAAGDEPACTRVLVVDDESEIGSMVRDMLESGGHEVATAESGAVALALLDHARFDAVLCDLRMPDMDGRALWREIARRHPHLARRVLFTTGDTLSAEAHETLMVSGCASLDKPFTKAELLRRVAGIVG